MALPMFEFLRRERQVPLTLLVSLDGSRAGAALVDRSGKKPTIRFASEIELAAEETPPAEQLLASLLQKLALALAAAKDQGLRAGTENDAPATVGEAHAFVGAPWCDSAVKRLCLSKETSMTLSQRGLDRILERNDFALRLKGDLDEKVVARAAANGYPVDNPVGMRARSFDLTLFLAAIEPPARDGIRAAVAAAFPGVKLDFASQARALYDVARGLFPHEGKTVILDVGGELIEAVRLEGDDLAAVASAPVGMLSAVRAVAQRCGLTPAAAASALRAHAESGAADCADGVTGAVADAARAWAAAVREALADISRGEHASRIVLSADPSMLAAATAVARATLPGAEIVPLSARALEPAIAADPSAHPTTVACALALHSRAAAAR
jgi:hypothetical protein